VEVSVFFVNEWVETEGGTFLCVRSFPFYTEEEAEFQAGRLAREGNKESDYLCQEYNMKGREVQSL
jgi:hypothetical protein